MTHNQTPPTTLKAIVDAIAIKRNVTLYEPARAYERSEKGNK